jgi:hypothetical protein
MAAAGLRSPPTPFGWLNVLSALCVLAYTAAFTKDVRSIQLRFQFSPPDQPEEIPQSRPPFSIDYDIAVASFKNTSQYVCSNLQGLNCDANEVTKIAATQFSQQ